MRFIIIVLLSGLTLVSRAQELNCEVSVNYQKLESVDPTMFTDMKQIIYEFINNRKWTGDQYKPHEKIECSILIDLETVQDNTNFVATITVQSRRPVYGTSYNSPIFSYQDKQVNFLFDRYATLEYSETSFLSNLTSLMAYYAYMIIGYDYDSYSNKGGSPYFTKAQQIVSMASTSGYTGWASNEQRNRYWLVENHLQPRFVELRSCMYEYHRLGLDQMADDLETGRKNITRALKNLEVVHRNFPNSYNIRVFFDAKADEIIKLYSEASREEKDEVVEILNKVDPANILKYQKIME
jgi:hypothetical protein